MDNRLLSYSSSEGYYWIKSEKGSEDPKVLKEQGKGFNSISGVSPGTEITFYRGSEAQVPNNTAMVKINDTVDLVLHSGYEKMKFGEYLYDHVEFSETTEVNNLWIIHEYDKLMKITAFIHFFTDQIATNIDVSDRFETVNVVTGKEICGWYVHRFITFPGGVPDEYNGEYYIPSDAILSVKRDGGARDGLYISRAIKLSSYKVTRHIGYDWQHETITAYIPPEPAHAFLPTVPPEQFSGVNITDESQIEYSSQQQTLGFKCFSSYVLSQPYTYFKLNGQMYVTDGYSDVQLKYDASSSTLYSQLQSNQSIYKVDFTQTIVSSPQPNTYPIDGFQDGIYYQRINARVNGA